MKRIEKDSIGKIEVENKNLWGAQTQRSLMNFDISDRKLPINFIHAIVEVKRACAVANLSFGVLDRSISDVMVKASDEILEGRYDDQFPLDVYQTGSGTQTNMNVNEVISNRAIQILGGKLGSKIPVHPNDHVNRGQSSNDVIPTAMHVSAVVSISKNLLPALDELMQELKGKKEEFWKIIKIGRTHLMDAVPLTLGQEFSGYVAQLELARSHIVETTKQLSYLAIGGTAVGTGLNAHPQLDSKVCEILSDRLEIAFYYNVNKFALIASKDSMLAVSGSLRVLAVALMKIANDIRWLASGPRAGLGELILPANEPGSSIMPGKVNPTQNEMIVQVAAQVIGNDTAISTGAQNSYMELNLSKTMIISNLLESIDILSRGMKSFAERAIKGLRVNERRVNELVNSSLMLVTALTKHPKIGYDLAAKIAKKAHEENKSISEVLREDKILTEEEIQNSLDLTDMVNIDR